MASLDQQFRTLLHTHLDRSGTSGRRFGLEALGDPGFVASLAKGRRLGLKTADRVLAFTGGQLAAALAVGAALVGSVLRFNAMQLMGAVGVGVALGLTLVVGDELGGPRTGKTANTR